MGDILTLYNLEISFRYKFYDTQSERNIEVTHEKIISNGLFEDFNIRNQNFYDEFANENLNSIQQQYVKISLPLTNNYITKKNIDDIITNSLEKKSSQKITNFEHIQNYLLDSTTFDDVNYSLVNSSVQKNITEILKKGSLFNRNGPINKFVQFNKHFTIYYRDNIQNKNKDDGIFLGVILTEQYKNTIYYNTFLLYLNFQYMYINKILNKENKEIEHILKDKKILDFIQISDGGTTTATNKFQDFFDKKQNQNIFSDFITSFRTTIVTGKYINLSDTTEETLMGISDDKDDNFTFRSIKQIIQKIKLFTNVITNQGNQTSNWNKIGLEGEIEFVVQLEKKLKEEEEKYNTKTNPFERFQNNNLRDFFNRNLSYESNKEENKKSDDGEGTQIKRFFKILKNEYDKYSAFDFKTNKLLDGSRRNDIPKSYNTKEEMINIIFDYCRYIDSDTYSKYKKDKTSLFNEISRNDKKFKYIIAYYNVLTILKIIYMINGTILYDMNFNGSKYKQILDIKPVIQSDNYNKINNQLKFEFFIETKEIINSSRINFFINLINIEYKNYKNKTSDDKIESKYINYGNKLFTNKKNINDFIAFDSNINFNKLINEFQIYKDRNIIFKKIKADKLNEVFMNNVLFDKIKQICSFDKDDKLKDNKDKIEYLNKIFTKYYIEKFFFKKNDLLFKNNKFYQINNVKIACEKLDKDKKQKKIQNLSNSKYIYEENSDIRLRIEEQSGQNYIIYLDVEYFIKQNKDDKISFKRKFNAYINCPYNASVLDNLFKKLLSEYYTENTFKNLLKNKVNNINDDDDTMDDNDIANDNLDNNKKKTKLIGGINKVNKINKLNKINKVNKKYLFKKYNKKYNKKYTSKNKKIKLKNKTIKK